MSLFHPFLSHHKSCLKTQRKKENALEVSIRLFNFYKASQDTPHELKTTCDNN